MLDLKFILANLDLVKERTKQRNYDFDFDTISTLDAERRVLINKAEALKAERNEISKKVGQLKRDGKDTAQLQEKVKSDAATIQDFEVKLEAIQLDLNKLLLNLPNIIDDRTPIGKDESDNVEIRRHLEPRKFDFEPKPHWDLGADLKMIDFERGAKIAKARFSILTGMGAKLERALSAFMLDTHSQNGYVEVQTPYLVNEKAMIGTGQLPKFQGEQFYCERDDLYLIPTAEVPVTNLYSDEILNLINLPIKHACLTACFRREAGSYGKDVRGLIRQHQFNKVELVKICTPESSIEEHERLTNDAERILQLLNLPYRVITLSSGDVGFSSSITYDIEVWLPAQNCYREISSCSNFKDFQARRANIRYRDANGKVQFAHTINGSGLAVGRTLVAVMENYQQADGSIAIPEVLKPYLKI